MKVLIADKLSPKAVDALKKLEADVSVKPDLGAEDLPSHIKDYEILVVRSTKVTGETFAAAEALSLVIRAGAGVNTIDLDSASEKGVHVANCPGKNTDAVAELAIGLLIATDRQIVNASVDLREGRWKKKTYQKAGGLKGRTLGIIGLGSIGKAVAKRAMGMEMNVVAWSRSLTPEKAELLGVGCQASLAELLKTSDAVSVHIASTPETKHLINAKTLSLLKDEAIFINCSRGEVVDAAALKEAVKEQGLRVGLDVYEDEPGSGTADFADTELASLVTGTPHIGASTAQASEAVATEVVRVVHSYISTGNPVNTVNIRRKTSAITNLVVRHFNKVGVLASVLDEIRNAGINIEEMGNTIFEGGKAAACTLKLDDEPTDDTLSTISGLDHIIQVALK